MKHSKNIKITLGELKDIIREVSILEKKKESERWDKAKTIGLPSGIQPSLSFSISEASGAVKPDEAKELIKKFPKGMKKLGIDPSKADTLQVLGIGTRGTAFDLGNRVLKITNDASEAAVANILKGKNLSNVVNFYDVWAFGDTGFFGVTQEKLLPLSKADSKKFNDAILATGLPVWMRSSEADWAKVKEKVKSFIIRQVKKKFPENYNSQEAKDFVKSINDQWNLLVKEYKIRDLFNTLNSLGIGFHDYHAGNMMKRSDGSLVLIDLGMSKIAGPTGSVETIEERLRRFIYNL
jgi:hypothetical protein